MGELEVVELVGEWREGSCGGRLVEVYRYTDLYDFTDLFAELAIGITQPWFFAVLFPGKHILQTDVLPPNHISNPLRQHSLTQIVYMFVPYEFVEFGAEVAERGCMAMELLEHR